MRIHTPPVPIPAALNPVVVQRWVLALFPPSVSDNTQYPVHMIRRTPLALAATLLLTGCASRYDQLRAKSGRVEAALVAERTKVSAAAPSDSSARLSHLSDLRATLSAANVGLGATRYIPTEQREVAYDILDEVYGTIEWNIPLGPGDKKKPLPSNFSPDGTLRLTN